MNEPWSFRARLARDMEGKGGGAGSEAGAPPPDAAAAAAAAAATAGAGGDDKGAAPPAEKPWLETVKLGDDVKSLLVSNGFHTVRDDKGEARPATMEEALAKAAQAHDAAQRKLGAKPEDLLAAPKADQPLAEWMKANARRLGVPETPEAYKLEKPKLPEGMAWDAAFEQEALAKFHAAGMPKGLAQEALNLFAGKMAAQFEASTTTITEARQALMTELRADWGGQTEARIGQAARAFQHFAQAAGLDAETQGAVVAQMAGAAGKGGDARMLKLWAKVHEAMGEDRMPTNIPNIGGFSTTPVEAKARLEAIKAKGGDYEKATQARDAKRQAELRAEIATLSKIIAPPRA